MVDKEDLKKAGYSMLGFIGIVLFFDGVYNGIGGLPIIENWYVCLTIGLTMLVCSGSIYKLSATFESIEEMTTNVIKEIHAHPERHEFHIIYDDKVAQKKIPLHALKIKRIEKGFIVFQGEQGQDVYIPLNRISHTLYKGQMHWDKSKNKSQEGEE